MQPVPFAIRFPLWRIVREEQPYYLAGQIIQAPENDKGRMRRTWSLLLNPEAMSQLSLTANQLAMLLAWHRIEVLAQRPPGWIGGDVPEHEMVVVLPENAPSATDQTPLFVGQPENLRAGLSIPPSAYLEWSLQQKREEIQPRPLTEDEITDVLEVMPSVYGAAQSTTQTVREQIQRTMRSQLRSIKLTPLGIPDFKDDMVRQFEKSRVQPGTTSGIAAAESLGGPITQMSLNSFHVAGSSKNVSYGIDGVRELLFVSKKRRHPSTTIHFKNRKMTYDEVFAKRVDIVETMIGSLITDFIVDLKSQVQTTPPWWESVYLNVVNPEAGPIVAASRWVMRLTMDVNRMYAMRVTPNDIITAIELSSPDNTVVCVASPIDEGIIDIYPNETIIAAGKPSGLPLQEIGLAYLQTSLEPALDKIRLKGVPGIRTLFPIVSPVWQIVKEELRVYSDADVKNEPDTTRRALKSRAWFLIYNPYRMRISGIGADSIRAVCEAAGLAIENEGPDYMTVIMPEIPIEQVAEEAKKQRNITKPGVYIQSIIEQHKEAQRVFEEKEKAGGVRFPRAPITPLLRAAEYVYADTDGTNLKALFKRADIDSTRTICNDFFELMEVLGLEATRNYLIKELLGVLGYDGSYTNPSQVILLVDFMCNRAIRDKQSGRYRPTPITFTGISRQPIGPLAKASNERAMDTFRDAGAFGTEEKIVSTSTSIYVGQKIKAGTGFVGMELDDEKIREYEARMATRPAKVDAEALRGALANIQDDAWGVTPFQYEELIGEGEAGVGAGAPTEVGIPAPQTTIVGPAPTTLGLIQAAPLPAFLRARPNVPTQLAAVAQELPAAPAGPPPAPTQVTVTTLPTVQPTGLGLPATVAARLTRT